MPKQRRRPRPSHVPSQNARRIPVASSAPYRNPYLGGVPSEARGERNWPLPQQIGLQPEWPPAGPRYLPQGPIYTARFLPVAVHQVSYHKPIATRPPPIAQGIQHAPRIHRPLPQIPYGPPHVDSPEPDDDITMSAFPPAKRPRLTPSFTQDAANDQYAHEMPNSTECHTLPSRILQYFEEFVAKGLLHSGMPHLLARCAKLPEDLVVKCFETVSEYAALGDANGASKLLDIVMGIEKTLAEIQAKTGQMHGLQLSNEAQQSLLAIQQSVFLPPLLLKQVSEALSYLDDHDIADLVASLTIMENEGKDLESHWFLRALQIKVALQSKDQMVRPLSDEEDYTLQRLVEMGALPQDKMQQIRACLSEIAPIASLRLLGQIEASYPLDYSLAILLARTEKAKRKEAGLPGFYPYYNRGSLTPEEEKLVADLVAEGKLPERWVTAFRTKLYMTTSQVVLKGLQVWEPKPELLTDFRGYMAKLEGRLKRRSSGFKNNAPPERSVNPFRELTEKERILLSDFKRKYFMHERERLRIQKMMTSVPSLMALEVLNELTEFASRKECTKELVTSKLTKMLDDFEWLPIVEKQRLLES